MALPDQVISAFPSLRPPWPAQLVPADDGTPRWGEWDPTTGAVHEAPVPDPRLPGLERARSQGRLVSYRPQWRAVVRQDVEGAPSRWIEVLRRPRTTEVAERYRDLAAVTSRAGVPLRVPEVLEVDPVEGSVALSEVEGEPLASVTGSDVIEDALVEIGNVLARFTARDAVAALAERGAVPPRRAAIARRAADWATIAGGAAGDDSLAAEISDVATRVARLRLPDDPPVVAHGDLDDRNLLLGRPTEAELLLRFPTRPEVAVGVVDLDGAGLGEPGRDLASLSCHLVLRSLLDEGGPDTGDAHSALLTDAFIVAGGDVAPAVLSAWQANTYLRLACVHLFRRPSRHVVADLLALARAHVTG